MLPALVEPLSGLRVIKIAAGGSHSAAITENGVLYTWGKGSYGRLGHGEFTFSANYCPPCTSLSPISFNLCPFCLGNVDDKMAPTEVKGMSGHKVVDVSCSSGDGHTLALDDKGMDLTCNTAIYICMSCMSCLFMYRLYVYIYSFPPCCCYNIWPSVCLYLSLSLAIIRVYFSTRPPSVRLIPLSYSCW